MKHFAKFGCGLLAVMMAACSSEEPIPVDGNGSGNGAEKDVYATLTLKLPSSTGSRAYGEKDPEFEVGQAVENNVGKVLVVLATKDAAGEYRLLTKAESDAKPNFTNVPDNTVKYVLNFSSDEMDPKPLADGSTIPSPSETNRNKVYVFVYCNPTAEFLTDFNKLSAGSAFVDMVGDIKDKDKASIWQDNQFLMTNWVIVDEDNSKPGKKNGWVEMPTREELVSEHGKPESPFNLGTIEVKRAVARFDFMTTTVDNELGANVYPINDIDGVTRVGAVELTHMAMFNIIKNYYYLPRTSTNWNWGAGTTTVCSGLEEEFGYTGENAVNNYVVSYNKDSFKQKAITNSDLAKYYFSSIYNNALLPLNDNTVFDWVTLNDWDEKHGADNADWNKPGLPHNYRIWRYATENTIPALLDGSTKSQRAGITTGVVFRGAFKPVNTDRWNGNAVYVYKDIVYGDYRALKEYVAQNPTSLVAVAVKASGSFNAEIAENDPKLKESVLSADDEDNGFKAYVSNSSIVENGKTIHLYEMYYFYYNRHKSNNNASVMGINEFGVVRNNVYKLAVTKCGTFGSPKPPKPEDPDEEENAYFSVSCIVLPWTVRVNDIEF